MKTLLIATALLMGSFTFAAEVRTSPATIHSMYFDNATDIEVRVVAKDVETDGCNHYGLAGDIREVKVPEGTTTMVQDFVADYGIMSTEMACGDDVEPGLVTLEGHWFAIDDASYVSIYAPARFELEVRVR